MVTCLVPAGSFSISRYDHDGRTAERVSMPVDVRIDAGAASMGQMSDEFSISRQHRVGRVEGTSRRLPLSRQDKLGALLIR